MARKFRVYNTHKSIWLRGTTVDYILDGSCTCLRLASFSAPDHYFNGEVLPHYEGETRYKKGEYGVFITGESGTRWLTKIIKCRAGKIGCNFRVVEKYAVESKYDHLRPGDIKKVDKNPKIVYAQDVIKGKSKPLGVWRKARKAPVWTSRIELRIKNIKLERLLDHNREDIFREGPFRFSPDCDICGGEGRTSTIYCKNSANCVCTVEYLDRYARYWDSTQMYAKYYFEKNPWTWVIDFERVK